MIHGGTISSATDIWPLGLVFWEMLALMPPHSQMDDTFDESVDSSQDDSMLEHFTERYGMFDAFKKQLQMHCLMVS